MKLFRTIWRSLTPGWLQVGDGELVFFLLGLMKDAMAERARLTVLAAFPSTAPEDALDLIGHDRAIPRGPFEDADSYRLRLRAWRYPLGHRIRGSARALLEQVSFAMRGTEYTTIDARGTRWRAGDLAPTRGITWAWDAIPLFPRWGRYWIVVKSTAAKRTWGSVGTTWGAAGGTWGSAGITAAEWAAVKTITSNARLGWTPAGRKANTLVVYFPGQAFPMPTGDWNAWPNRDPQYTYEPLSSGIE